MHELTVKRVCIAAVATSRSTSGQREREREYDEKKKTSFIFSYFYRPRKTLFRKGYAFVFFFLFNISSRAKRNPPVKETWRESSCRANTIEYFGASNCLPLRHVPFSHALTMFITTDFIVSLLRIEQLQRHYVLNRSINQNIHFTYTMVGWKFCYSLLFISSFMYLCISTSTFILQEMGVSYRYIYTSAVEKQPEQAWYIRTLFQDLRALK